MAIQTDAMVELDLDGLDFDSIDESQEVPAGWYQATIKSAEVISDDKGIFIELVYSITTKGPGFGRVVKHKLNAAPTTDGAKRRIAILAKRLGLATAEDFAEGRVARDFAEAVGAPIVVQIEREESKAHPGKFFSSPTFAGVYLANDPQVASVELNTGGGASAPAAAAPKSKAAAVAAPRDGRATAKARLAGL